LKSNFFGFIKSDVLYQTELQVHDVYFHNENKSAQAGIRTRVKALLRVLLHAALFCSNFSKKFARQGFMIGQATPLGHWILLYHFSQKMVPALMYEPSKFCLVTSVGHLFCIGFSVL
jgi:hypothetical protein